MGQKVNPILIRLGLPATNNSKYLNPITRKTEDLFDRKDPHTFPSQNYSKNIGEIYIIEKYLLEIFEKSGIFISNLRIRKTSSLYTIYLDIFQRNHTLSSSTKTRKIRWTARKLKWRLFTKEDTDFYSKFFQKYVTNNTPVQWRIRYLNTDSQDIGKGGKIKKNKITKQGRVYMEDGEQIFKIISQEPGARLLANFIREEFLHVQRHSLFINYIFANLDKICLSGNKLTGSLISIKGRINGSDRSKKSIFRKGSLPLHTFDAPIDYYFTEVITRYGVCSIKIWLKYDLFLFPFFLFPFLSSLP